MSVIIIVEPHPLIRLGIEQLLSTKLPERQIKGVDYVNLTETQATDQHCALLILSLPSFEAIEELTTAAAKAYLPKSILLLSENSKIPDWGQHCHPSVAGYLQKNAAPEILQASVKLVLAGGTCFPPSSQSSSLGNQIPLPLTKPAQAAKWPIEPETPEMTAGMSASECEKLGLTPRQYEVLVLLARGYPMKTVGRLLNISVATAKAHTEMLYQRLDVHSRNAAVYAAVSRGATLGWPNVSVAKQHSSANLTTTE